MSNDNMGDRQRLRRSISVSLETVAIGALVAMEEEMGDLWGHGLSEDELSEEQAVLSETWKEVRERILKRLSDSKRAAFLHLESYTVRSKKFFGDLK